MSATWTVRREQLTVIAFACSEGIWTRIRGPLTGHWYGPWRFHDVRVPYSTRSASSQEEPT